MKVPRKHLLVLGIAHSGTTLLCAMLGRHPDINMLCESLSGDDFKLLGKLYCGNKFLLRQVGMKNRANKFGHFFNRIVSLNNRIEFRVYPQTVNALKDYPENTKMILITRNSESVVGSLMKRNKYPRRLAEWYVKDKRKKEKKIIKQYNPLVIGFGNLLAHPEDIMEQVCRYLSLPYSDRMLEGAKYNIHFPYGKILTEKNNP